MGTTITTTAITTTAATAITITTAAATATVTITTATTAITITTAAAAAVSSITTTAITIATAAATAAVTITTAAATAAVTITTTAAAVTITTITTTAITIEKHPRATCGRFSPLWRQLGIPIKTQPHLDFVLLRLEVNVELAPGALDQPLAFAQSTPPVHRVVVGFGHFAHKPVVFRSFSPGGGAVLALHPSQPIAHQQV